MRNNLAFYGAQKQGPGPPVVVRCDNPAAYMVYFIRASFAMLRGVSAVLAQGLAILIRPMFHVPDDWEYVDDPHNSFSEVVDGWRWLDFRDSSAWAWVEQQTRALKQALDGLDVRVQIPDVGRYNEHNMEGSPSYYTHANMVDWSIRMIDLYVNIWGANRCMVNQGAPAEVIQHAARVGVRAGYQDSTGKETAESIWWYNDQQEEKIPAELRDVWVGFGEVTGWGILSQWADKYNLLPTRLDELAVTRHVQVIGNMQEGHLVRLDQGPYGVHFRKFETTMNDTGGTDLVYAFFYGGIQPMTTIIWAGQQLYRRNQVSDEEPWGPPGSATRIHTAPAQVNLADGDRYSLVVAMQQDGEPLTGLDKDENSTVLDERPTPAGDRELLFQVLGDTVIAPVYGDDPGPDPDPEYVTRAEFDLLKSKLDSHLQMPHMTMVVPANDYYKEEPE